MALMCILSLFICLRMNVAGAMEYAPGNESLARACKDDVKLCLNNGTCYEHSHDGIPNRYYCNCTAPYIGGICRSAQSQSQEASRKLITGDGLVECRADSKLCKNGGTCYSVVQTDRSFDQDQGLILYGCNCKRGFYGGYCQYNMSEPAIRTGEESNACDPNPCMNECDCVLSCKHELGYYCVSDEGFVGKNCSIEVPAVSCEADSIIITISPNFYDEFDMGLNNSYFYLTPNANATLTTSYVNCLVRPENGARGSLVFKLSLPFDECDMKFAMSDDVTIFTNTLWVNRENLGDGVDMPVHVIEWQCMYDRNYSVISRLQPVIHQDATLVREEGVFDVSLALCKVGACPADCPDRYQVNSSAVYTIGQRIHLAIRTNFAGEQETGIGLVTTVSEMFLSCSVDPVQPRLIDLVLNGCPHETAYGLSLDVTTGFIESAQSACASFLLPRVTCDQFYVHVFVQICQRDALQTCAKHSNTKHCSSRRSRRSIAAEVSEHSAIGPISVIDGSAGSRLVQLYPDDGGRIIYDRESTLLQSNQITEVPKPEGGVDVWILLFGVFCSLLLVSLLVVVSKPLVISTPSKPATDLRL